MARRTQVPYEGKMVSAEQLEFEPEKEPFTVYRLEDGTVLKLKTILGSVARLVDRYKPDGEPIYVLSIGGMPIIEVNPELRGPTAGEPQAKKE